MRDANDDREKLANLYAPFENVNMEEARHWEGKSLQNIDRDMRPVFRRQNERLAKDMLSTTDDKDLRVTITKADLMYTRMVWRSDVHDDADPDVLVKTPMRKKTKRRTELWDKGDFTTLLTELRAYDERMIGEKEMKKEVETPLKTRQKCVQNSSKRVNSKRRGKRWKTPQSGMDLWMRSCYPCTLKERKF